jgi:hypothetical protein
MNELYEDIHAWKIRVTQRNIDRGLQGREDAVDLLANGVVTKPDSYREARQMCLDAAVAYSVMVDAGKRSKKEL